MTGCEECANFKPREKPKRHGRWEIWWVGDHPHFDMKDENGKSMGLVCLEHGIGSQLRRFLESLS